MNTSRIIFWLRANVLLVLILLLFLFLALFRLNELMPFIGDQAWFYLSARDLILGKSFPLVGITSSHTWIHQGPLWTYLLAVILLISHFNPLAPAYVTVFLGSATLVFFYIFVSRFFSRKVALMGSLLLATSPLFIIHMRFAYHTTLIPLAILVFEYMLYTWIKGEKRVFPYIFLMVGVLYNLELSTQIAAIQFLAIFAYGIVKKKRYVKKVLTSKITTLSIVFLIIPLLPVIIYDFLTKKFAQTIMFSLYIPYKVLMFFLHLFQGSVPRSDDIARFILDYGQRILFLPNARIAVLLFFLAFFFMAYKTYMLYKTKKITEGWVIFSSYLFFGVGGLIINQSPSEGYLPVIIPALVLSVSYMLGEFSKNTFGTTLVIFLLGILTLGNVATLFSKDYLMGNYSGYGPHFTERVRASKILVKMADGKEYTIKGKGVLSGFRSFTMPYEYLTWLYGNEPTQKNVPVRFEVEEKKDGRVVVRQIP